MQAPMPTYRVTAKNPTESERAGGLMIVEHVQEITGRKPNKLLVVLRDPSGARGGGGGSTSDLVVLDATDEEDATEIARFDVYTPERGTKTDGMQKYIRGKVGSQNITRVVVDVCNFGDKADQQAATMLGWADFKGKLVIINSKTRTWCGKN